MKKSINQRLKSGVFANYYAQGLNIAIQLLSVPVFLSYFDLKSYGNWLMYLSVAQFFLMADIGIFAIVMNRVTMSAGKNDWLLASKEFSNGLFWFLLSTPLVLALSALVLYSFNSTGRLNLDEGLTIGLLIAYSLTFNLTGLLEAVFRAYEKYALGVTVLETIRAVEWLSAILVLVLTKSMLWIAADLMVFRLVSTIVVAIYLSRRFRELVWCARVASPQEIRGFLRDGLAWIIYRVGDMVSLQGATVFVGVTLGGSAAATFNTFRTVTRFPLQFLNGAVNPYWPEFAKLFGMGNYTELTRLLNNAKRLTNRLVLFLYALTIIIAPWFISVWSKKIIIFDWLVFLVMTFTAVLLALWYPYKVLLASTNRIGMLSFYGLFIYGATVYALQIIGIDSLLQVVCMFLFSEIFVAILNIYVCKRRA